MALVLTLLRFGPRQHSYDPNYDNDDDTTDEEQAMTKSTCTVIGGSVGKPSENNAIPASIVSALSGDPPEQQLNEQTPLVDNSTVSQRFSSLTQSQRKNMSKSFRVRASLGAL